MTLIDHSKDSIFVTNGHKRFRLIAEYGNEYWVQITPITGQFGAGLLTFTKDNMKIVL